MATIKVKTADGGDAGSLELNDAVFGVEPNLRCVRAAVNQYRANQRAGTHSTKTRAFVSGGGRKPWRQKGTGRARQGSIRAVQWRHGAISFGPLPRDYAYRLNRKVKNKAICSALSELAKTERIIAVQDFGLEEPKTKRMAEILGKVGVAGSALLLSEGNEKNLALSARNLPLVCLSHVDNVNIYDLVIHDYLVATPAALKRIEGAFA